MIMLLLVEVSYFGVGKLEVMSQMLPYLLIAKETSPH